MATIDVYPSTDDVDLTNSPVLDTLLTARERYAMGATANSYVFGGVCAVGAIIVADGKESAWADREGSEGWGRGHGR